MTFVLKWKRIHYDFHHFTKYSCAFFSKTNNNYSLRSIVVDPTLSRSLTTYLTRTPIMAFLYPLLSIGCFLLHSFRPPSPLGLPLVGRHSIDRRPYSFVGCFAFFFVAFLDHCVPSRNSLCEICQRYLRQVFVVFSNSGRRDLKTLCSKLLCFLPTNYHVSRVRTFNSVLQQSRVRILFGTSSIWSIPKSYRLLANASCAVL